MVAQIIVKTTTQEDSYIVVSTKTRTPEHPLTMLVNSENQGWN